MHRARVLTLLRPSVVRSLAACNSFRKQLPTPCGEIQNTIQKTPHPIYKSWVPITSSTFTVSQGKSWSPNTRRNPCTVLDQTDETGCVQRRTGICRRIINPGSRHGSINTTERRCTKHYGAIFCDCHLQHSVKACFFRRTSCCAYGPEACVSEWIGSKNQLGGVAVNFVSAVKSSNTWIGYKTPSSHVWNGLRECWGSNEMFWYRHSAAMGWDRYGIDHCCFKIRVSSL